MLLCITAGASGEETVCFELHGQVHSSLPTLTIRVSTAGEQDITQRRPHPLQAEVTAKDGSFSQRLLYRSNETPAMEHAAAMAQLKDLNFDGYLDLVLLTAQGARNVYFTVAV